MTSPHLRAPGRAVLALLLLASASVAMATATAGPAAAACAGGNRSISGTVEGQDHRFVSAQVSITLLDSAGREIGMDGCVLPAAGYARTVLVNAKAPCCFILPGIGAAASPYTDQSGTYALTRNWSLSGIPSNAVQVWIETYTKRAGGQPNTTTERYGHSIRRLASISTTPIHIVQPLRCGIAGGSTGSLAGRVFDNGAQVTASRVSAFSTSPEDGNGGAVLGFNVVGAHPTGQFRVDALTPGTYAIFLTANGVTRRVDGLRVTACAETRIDLAVRGSVPPNPDIAVAGDWDGDGGTGIGIFDPSTREWHLRDAASAGPVQRAFGFGGPGDIPVVGDWNGDGVDGIGVYRPSTREWLLRETAGGGSIQRRFGFGGPGDIPVVGDWNGDGVDGIGVYRPSTREWLLRETAGGGSIQRRFGFGGPGDIPVVGDWNGDGVDGIGVYRPSTREWLLRETAGGGSIQRRFGFGGPGDIPVVGDWNGDSVDGIGVFRRSSANWLLRQTAAGGGVDAQFAYDGD